MVLVPVAAAAAAAAAAAVAAAVAVAVAAHAFTAVSPATSRAYARSAQIPRPAGRLSAAVEARPGEGETAAWFPEHLRVHCYSSARARERERGAGWLPMPVAAGGAYAPRESCITEPSISDITIQESTEAMANG